MAEDTFDGVQLGKDTVKGKVFMEVQYMLKRLCRRGFLLSLCSKNEAHEARHCLYNHPGSVLEEEDIVAERINWTPKAENIHSIVKEVGIGLDACIFIDDNYVECDEVKTRCPGVESIVVPKNIYEYPNLLKDSTLLRSSRPTNEDRERTKTYKANKKRAASAVHISSDQMSRDKWLVSLQMKVEIRGLDCGSRIQDRIIQLFSRTNQFNLVYSKYTHGELQSLMERDNINVLYASLSDRFGCDGIVACIITESIQSSNLLCILDYVVSCRVFRRGVESAILASVLSSPLTKERVRFRHSNHNRNAASTRFVESLVGSDLDSVVQRSTLLDKTLADHISCYWL